MYKAKDDRLNNQRNAKCLLAVAECECNTVHQHYAKCQLFTKSGNGVQFSAINLINASGEPATSENLSRSRVPPKMRSQTGSSS